MRILLILSLFCLAPAIAEAQLIIQQGKPVSDAAANEASMKPPASEDDGTGPVEAVINGTHFPASAITTVGDAAGRTSVEPANTATRKIIDADNPLWPTDTVDIFVSACAGMQHQMVAPCRCIIERLALKMPHNEFLKLSETDAVRTDPRYVAAREACLPRDQQPQPAQQGQ